MAIKYNFFGKNCLIDRALSNRDNLIKKLSDSAIKTNHILLLNQIHSSEVFVVDDVAKIYGTQNLPKADALVTNLENVLIGIVTADCSPILFFDSEKKIIAATHAGWRGAKLGIIFNTVEQMKNLGAKNIQAIIGPMIHQVSYQVDENFRKEFLAEKKSNEKFFIKDEERFLFNLPAYVEEKISFSGIDKITNLSIDTYQNEKDFFSFRRSTHKKEQDCGRNISWIAITK
jgi:hypothetical protein